MKALTLWPEWLPTFTALDKRIENRGWFPPKSLIGERIALHAGAHVGGGAWKRGLWMEETAADAGWTVQISRAGGLHGLPAMHWDRPMADGSTERDIETIHLAAIVVTARLVRVERGPADPKRWAMPDAVHWHLAELRRVVEPVPCVGHQGLWNVPEDVLRDVLAREVPLVG